MTMRCYPNHLNGIAALMTAERTTMGKERDERDTAFVKRIVATYLSACYELGEVSASGEDASKP